MTSQNELLSRIQSLTRKHDSFTSPRMWFQYIYKTFEVSSTSRICCVHKHQSPTACVFTIQEFGEVVMPHIAASAAGIDASKAISMSYEGPVDLESTLKYWKDVSCEPCLCMSDSFTDNHVLFLRWNDTRTLHSTYKIFKEKLSSLVKPHAFDASSTLKSELAQTQTSSDTITSTSMLTHLVNLNYQHHSEAMTFLLAKTQDALKVARTTKTQVEETSRKLGYINEETWRLTDEEGALWPKSFQFDSLSELVDWVGMKMKRSRDEKQMALKTVVLLCLDKFDKFQRIDSTPWDDVSNLTKIVLIY